MKVKRLEIDNFLAIGKFDVSLSDKGLVLVQGENLDDSSQNSNGSGKSSFPDALSWCFYGVTARGESGDLIVNRTAGKDCRVAATVEDDGEEYLIARHRKHKKEKNRLTVTRLSDGADLTKGTDKATQEVVTKLLGCSLQVFVSAIYAGQEAIPDLPRMTDKQLKELVEEASGTTRLQRAYEIANKRINKLAASIDSIGRKIDSDNSRIADLTAAKTEAENRQAAWGGLRAKRLTDAVSLLKVAKAAHEGRPQARDIAPLEQEVKNLERALFSIEAEKQRMRALERERDAAKTAEISAEQAFNFVKRDAEAARSAYDKIDHKIGCPCNECGKPYSAEDIAPAKEIAAKNLREKVKNIAVAKEKLEAAREASGNAVKALESFVASMTDVSETVAKKAKIEQEIRDAKEYARESERIQKEYQRLAQEAKKIKDEENPHDATIASLKVQIEKIEAGLKDAFRDKDALIKEMAVLSDAAAVFSPAGVRAHILDTVTPFLNDRTAHYLSILSDGNLSAEWSTLNKLKSGEIREKFAITVSSATGGETFSLISGGEKRKVRLACSMALQDLVASRASKPFDLYIADEIDDAVDASGLERLMTILENKARERGTVLVISHNSLNDWIRDSIKVVKSGGFAKIEGTALDA